jgi:chromosome segregation ATPase
MLGKLDSNPSEVAQHYHRLAQTVTKEYRILQHAHDKLQHRFDELKGKNDELKVEAREAAQEIMNMESALFDLRGENERLRAEVDKGRDADLRESVRAEIEEECERRVVAKQQEIDQVNEKLARISKSNIDMKSKIDRLELSVAELSQELEAHRSRVSTLEMELEMTKDNGERDTEKLLETIRLMEGERDQQQSDKAQRERQF